MHIIKSILFLFILSGTFSQSKYQKDFEYYWQTVKDNFAYFDLQETNWQKVKSIYQPIADTITTDNSFISFLEIINNELYNGHISLNVNLESSNRLIPTGADLWVEYRDESFIISAVRKDFNAELAGLEQGMQILKYNDIPIETSIKEFLPRAVPYYNIQMYEYAANMLLAGRHNSKRSITTLF
ncbi:MAG: peptidase, partial [Ignavibacteriales bacterium]